MSTTIQQEADLLLKLYDLRREPVMRQARDWYFREFNPESFADFQNALFGEHSGHLRMVVTYWDMASALVNRGAISLELFNETNGEHLGAFAKIEPFLADIRQFLNAPRFCASLEKLVDSTPEGRQQLATFRERFKRIRAELIARQQTAAARG